MKKTVLKIMIDIYIFLDIIVPTFFKISNMGNQTVSTLPVHTNLSAYACTTETGIYQHRASRALVEKCDMEE